jgi:type I restriction enzyme S subunit
MITEINRIISLIDETELLASQDKRRVARLRQSILKWAFEGKLVDQDPTDEPASVLLERIKAQRHKVTPEANGRRRRNRKVKTA